MDVLKEYLGLIQEFPGSVDIHKGAMSKVKDCEKMKEEGRIDVSFIYVLYKSYCYSVSLWKQVRLLQELRKCLP